MRLLRWLNPFFAEHYVLRTEVQPEVCVQRLSETIASRYSSKTWFWRREDRPVFGRVRGREFHYKKVHTLVRPWFLQEVRGVVATAGTGSEIRIRLGLTVPNALVFAVMFVVVLVGAGGLVPAIVAPGSWPLAGWLSSSVAAVIFVVVYAQERLFWVRDNAFLLWFLEDQLNARRVDA